MAWREAARAGALGFYSEKLVFIAPQFCSTNIENKEEELISRSAEG